MINVLVVENEQVHLEIIQEAIKKELGHLVKTYPKNITDKEKNLNDQNFLINKLTERNFQEVAEFYQHIDLFIIDATLTPSTDQIGIDFHNYILKNKEGSCKTIVISNTNEMADLVDTRTIPFISKIEHGIDEHFPIVLLQKIKEAYQIGDKTQQKDLSLYKLFIEHIKQYGIKFALHRTWLYLRKVQRRIIDKLLLLLFYLLMTITLISGGYNIVNGIFKTHFKTASDTTYTLNNQNGLNDAYNKNDTIILQTAENIFLNLLPVFIVFGFYNYYKTNTRVSLLEGNTQSIDDDVSTKAMNLTKILFISSIISYVLIKIIEEIFFERTTDIVRLTAFGFFLFMLMTYYILLEKKHEPKKQK